jgi:SAM-dependent methyltransferase
LTAQPGPRASGHDTVEVYNEIAAAGPRVRDNWAYMTSKQLTDFVLLDKASIDGARVLNVGCFDPIDEIMFAHRVKSWTAVDLGERTILAAKETARAALSEGLFSRLDFQVADGTALPFDDASFDVVVSMSTVDHVPDASGRQRFIDEMARVASPGGRVVITVPNRWSRGYANRARLVPADEVPDFFEYCFSPIEFRRMVTRTGLSIRRFTSTSEVPVLAPRPVLPSISRRPLLSAWNTCARYFGARMGLLAIKE